MNMRSIARTALPLLLIVAACQDTPVMGPVTPSVTETLALNGPGLYTVFARSAKTPVADTVYIDVYVKDISVGADIGSYQGVINYDAGKLTFVDATGPSGVMSAWNETDSGVIKVAGAAANGLPKNQALLTLRFVQRGIIKGDAFTFQLDEVVQQSSFANLTSKVSKTAAIYSAQPLPADN